MPAKQKTQKKRADVVLFESGLVDSVREAAARIMSGKVMYTDQNGKEKKLQKPGDSVHVGSSFRFAGAKHPYVSRGGLKLAAALENFPLEIEGKICADIGISTGGFTDGLLQAGAKKVYGVDVGYGQTAWKIRTDPRVILFERTNVKNLNPSAFAETIDLLVIDVSFIGLSGLLPKLKSFLGLESSMICLIKPQFELPPDRVPQGGVVSEPALHQCAIDKVLAAASDIQLSSKGIVPSPIKGADGNTEYLVWLQ